MNLDLGSGYVEGHEIKASNYTLNTSSGDLSLDELRGDGNIKLSSGQNNISNIEGNLDIQISSGELQINDFKDKTTTKLFSGLLSIDHANFTDDSTMKITSGEINVGVGSDAPYCYNTSVTSGRINTPDSVCKDPDAFDIDLEVTSGDIRFE